MVTGTEILRAPEQGLLPTVAWRIGGEKPVYALDGGVYTASAAVNWGRSLGLFESFEELTALAGPPAMESGLVFVPALSGLACPHWYRRPRRLWPSLGLDHGPAPFMKAIPQRVACRTAARVAAITP